MNWCSWWWARGWVLLVGLLAACAGTGPRGDIPPEPPEQSTSWDEGCEDTRNLVLVCREDGAECGLFPCRDVFAPEILLARGGRRPSPVRRFTGPKALVEARTSGLAREWSARPHLPLQPPLRSEAAPVRPAPGTMGPPSPLSPGEGPSRLVPSERRARHPPVHDPHSRAPSHRCSCGRKPRRIVESGVAGFQSRSG